MRAHKFLLAALLLTSLPGCAPDEQTRAVLATARNLPPANRRIIIKTKLSRICPVPLSNAELERAANYVLANADDFEALWLVGRLDKFDAETRICRGAK